MTKTSETNYPSLTKPYYSWSDKRLATGTNSIADAMTGNTYFTGLSSQVLDFKTSVMEFNDQLAKCAKRDSDDIETKNVMRQNLITATIQLGIAAEQVANGSVTMLRSTEFPIRKTPQAVVLAKPTGLTLSTEGINPGELKVKIDGMKKISLVIEYTIDPLTPESQWESVTSTKCSILLTGLQGGKRYWVRVAAVGGNDQMMWGDTLQSPFIQEL